MKNTFSLSFLTFICFLIIGYSTSTFLFSASNAEVAVSETAEKNIEPVQSMQNGQRNILLIRVDSVNNPNPTLQGVWLLTYLPNETNINFLPIFPSGKSSLSDADNSIYQSFSLLRENSELILTQKFTDELKAKNYWWSGYLVFDQNIQEKMLSFFTGTYKNNGSQPGEQATQLPPDALKDAQAAFVYQLSTIKTACQYLSKSQNTNWSKFIFLMSNQFYSDLDPQLLLSDWNSTAASKHTLNCQFPTLQRQAGTNYMILLTSVMK